MEMSPSTTTNQAISTMTSTMTNFDMAQMTQVTTTPAKTTAQTTLQWLTRKFPGSSLISSAQAATVWLSDLSSNSSVSPLVTDTPLTVTKIEKTQIFLTEATSALQETQIETQTVKSWPTSTISAVTPPMIDLETGTESDKLQITLSTSLDSSKMLIYSRGNLYEDSTTDLQFTITTQTLMNPTTSSLVKTTASAIIANVTSETNISLGTYIVERKSVLMSFITDKTAYMCLYMLA